MATHTKRKKRRSRDRVSQLQLNKVKYLDNPRKILPNMYYVWQYYNHKDRKTISVVTEQKLYKKHICAVPYFTRYHAKDILLNKFGTTISDCHIIKGKRLIRQGITEIDGPKKRLFSVRHKGGWYKVRRFRYPIEWRLFPNARSFKISMYNYFFNHTRKEFDDHYKSIYIGERYGLDKSTNVSRGYAVKRTLYRLDGDNEALSDEDVNNLQKKWDNYKTLFINPKDKDKWKKVL